MKNYFVSIVLSLEFKYVMKYIKDEGIVGKFEQLSLDAETDMFIKRSIERSDWLFTQLYHNFAKVLNIKRLINFNDIIMLYLYKKVFRV